MATPFFRTTRSLKADDFRLSYLVISLVAALMLAWGYWFFAGEVIAVEISHQGRIEVSANVYPVLLDREGKVAQTHLALGVRVEKGDVLLLLDTSRENIRLTEARTRLDSAHAQLEALLAQREAIAGVFLQADKISALEAEVSRADLLEQETDARYKREVAQRLEQLYKADQLPELDRLKARGDMEMASTSVDRRRVDLALKESERRTVPMNAAAQIARLDHDIAELRGESAVHEAVAEQLELTISEARITAPASGVVGEVQRLQVGAFVRKGSKICTLVPEGEFKVFAHFSPEVAMGRLRPGQTAAIRLDGFPWTRYGIPRARVVSVGREVRDGLVQVDFQLLPDLPSEIPIQHGLPGQVEVEVGRFSPAELVLRATGKWIDGGSP